MPTKPNRAGEQQNYVPAGNGDASGEYGDNATGSNVNYSTKNQNKLDVKQLRKKALDMGLSLKYIGRKDILGGGQQEVTRFKQDNELKVLKDKGFSKEEIELLQKDAMEKQEEKTNSFKNFLKDKKDNYLKKSFGEDMQMSSNGKDFTFKHYINDDNINIVTKNVDYFKNKDTYVMWVGNNKVVYLKSWNVTPIKNSKYGNAYSVKLDRKYFKPYNSYQNDNLYFEKEDTFDDLVNIAKEQDKENMEWRI